MQWLRRYADLGGVQLVAQTGYTYDSLNRLSQINHQNAAGGSLAFYRFGYDAAGRILQTVDVDGTTDYSYDKTSQLTGADRAGTARDESYAYDANGNRTTAGYSTGTDNRLNSDGVYTYTYDNEGNLIQRVGNGPTRTFTWDYRNRLTEVRDNGSVTAAYTYDAMNRRISKSVNGTTTRFVYDRSNVSLEFTGASTIPSVRYLHGTMVDQVLAQEKGGQTSWMLTDQLGSVRDLVSNAGAVVGHFTYDSFGQVVSAASAWTVDSRYKFTGRELDGETGLYYYRARYYDARVGRFIGQDPIGFRAGDSNLYRYVGNRTTDRVDPSGTRDMRWPTNGVVTNSSSRPVIILNSTRVGDFKETLWPGQSTPDSIGRSKDVDGFWRCEDDSWVFYGISVGATSKKNIVIWSPSLSPIPLSVPFPKDMDSGRVIVDDYTVEDRWGRIIQPGVVSERGRPDTKPPGDTFSCKDLMTTASMYPNAATWEPVLPGDEELENLVERTITGAGNAVNPRSWNWRLW